MLFQRFIAFLFVALMPLLALAETPGTASTTTVRSTVYSTLVTYVTMTGSPPAGSTGTGSIIVTNSTIISSVSSPAKPTATEPPFTGAAAGTLRFSSGLAGAAIVAAVVGLF
ncbi:unnamed protein product [Tuber aestivum]|uniref:Uncharacterized protein n=1 Tax=Tuber aestivum TaxID=59557 RepID=A0A292Q6K8_9PEZI|nr:unnamed protein product [Tuber aestivum]